jgi:predicted dehydrogenase
MPAIGRSANGVLRALGTRRPEEARELVREHEIQRLYEGYAPALRDPEVDAVYIPLPNHLHHPWTLKALQAGKHVLCEKPLACTASQAREMAAAARDSGCVLMEALMYRFHPRSERVKRLVEEGAVGRPRLVRAAFCFAMEPEMLERGENCRLKPDTGGGALLDVGCYGVSVARWLLGSEPSAVQAQALYHDRTGVDVHLTASLRFGRDALATVEASFCAGLQQTYSVIGAEGAIELPHDAFIPWEKEALFSLRGRNQEKGEVLHVSGTDEYQRMVEHFADRVLAGRETILPPEDSVANTDVLDALAEAARHGRSVRIPRQG